MREKISPLPMIAVIAASAIGILIFSILQFRQKQELAAESVQQLATEHRETEAVMKAIGADAAQAAQQQQSKIGFTQSVELKKLEDEDRRWLAEHPLPTTPPR
jgi:uncharacterized protein HemX